MLGYITNPLVRALLGKKAALPSSIRTEGAEMNRPLSGDWSRVCLETDPDIRAGREQKPFASRSVWLYQKIPGQNGTHDSARACDGYSASLRNHRTCLNRPRKSIRKRTTGDVAYQGVRKPGLKRGQSSYHPEYVPLRQKEYMLDTCCPDLTMYRS